MREIWERVLTGFVAVLLVTATAPALAAGLPLPRTGLLSDGTRFEVAGDQLILIDRSGRKSPARDGTYKMTDGTILVVKNRQLVPGSAGAPPEPKPSGTQRVQGGSGSPLAAPGGGVGGPSSKPQGLAVKPVAPDLRVAAPTS